MQTGGLPPITANLILGVETKSTVDLNAIKADTVDFPGTYFESGWLCWDHPASQDKHLDPQRFGGNSTGDEWPADIIAKYCISAGGDFYVGAIAGATSNALGLAASAGDFGTRWTGWGRDVWMEHDIRQSALARGLFWYWVQDSKSIVTKGYATGGALTLADYARSVFKLNNGHVKSVIVVESGMINGDGPTNDRNWEADKWSAQNSCHFSLS